MMRKIVWAAVGVLFVAAPVAVFAQASGITDSCASNETLQCLQGEIVQLVQLLNLLLSQRDQHFTTSTTTVSTQNVSNGSVSLLATDPTPAPYSIVAGGTTGVTVSNFTLQPSGDNVNVQRIGLDLQAQQGSPADLVGGEAYIYQGATLVGTANFTGMSAGTCPPAYTGVPAGGCYFATSTLSVPITLRQSTQSSFTIKADVSPIGPGQSGVSGDDIVIGLSDVSAVSATAGQVVQSGSAPVQVGVRIFKSYPIVSLLPSQNTIADANDQVLMRFSVTANSSGPIGLAMLTPTISANGLQFSSVTSYGFSDGGFSIPIPGTQGGNLGTVNPSGGLTGWFTIPLSNAGQPIEVPAGATYYFEIVGNVSATKDVANVTTSLPGDSSYGGLKMFNVTGGQSGNFVWSPNDNLVSQYSTSDWTNGFGLQGLPSFGIIQAVTLLATSSPVITQPVVTPTTPTSPTCSDSFSPSPAVAGQTFTDTWNSTGATSMSVVAQLNGHAVFGPGPTGVNGSYQTSYATPGTYNYTRTAMGPGGTTTCAAVLTVTPPPTLTITASPMTVQSGGRANVSWSSTNGASSCSYLSTNNAPSDYSYNNSAPTTGETGVGPLTSNATYQITCGGQTASVTITVTPPPANAPTCSDSFSLSPLGAGQVFTDTWTSTGATSMTLVANLNGNPVIGPGPTGVTGSYQTSFLTPGTYDYTRTVTGPGGTAQCSTALLVLPNAAPGPVVTLLDNGTTNLVYTGTNYTVAWNSSGATSCTLSWQGTGTQASQQGSENIQPNTAGSGPSGLIGSYTFSCTDASGHTSSQSVSVSAPQSSAADANANLASAIVGLQGALQSLESWLGTH